MDVFNICFYNKMRKASSWVRNLARIVINATSQALCEAIFYTTWHIVDTQWILTAFINYCQNLKIRWRKEEPLKSWYLWVKNLTKLFYLNLEKYIKEFDFFPYCRAKFKLPPESAYFSALLQSFDCATCPQT